MVRFLRRFVVVLAALALTVSSGLVFAQAAPLPVPVNIQPVGPAPGGLQTMATYDARGVGGASNAGYYTRPVLVSNNTLGGLARGLLRRAAPVAAMLAAIEAVGWVIDELTGQVMIPASGTQPPEGSAVWCSSSWGSDYGGMMCGPSGQSFVGKNTGWPGGSYTVTAYIPQGGTSGLLQVNGGQVGGMTVQVHYYNPQVHPWLDATPAQPVADPDLGTVVRDNPHLWPDALRNPDGSVNRNPDVMNEAERLRDALLNPDPVTNPSPDPTGEWDTGNQWGEPQNGPSPNPAPWPALCEWAPNLCAWLDWTQREPVWGDDDDGLPLPTEDPLANLPDFDANMGGGSCPADEQVETSYGTITISYSLFCQLASTIGGLVLAAAWLGAAWIIVGVRRG